MKNILTSSRVQSLHMKPEVIGKHARLLNPGSEIYFENGIADSEYFRIFGDLKEYLKNPENSFWERDVLNKKKDGLVCWVRLSIGPIREKEGTILNNILEKSENTAALTWQNIMEIPKTDFQSPQLMS